MKVRVDRELCALHGQCVYAAPAVFTIEGEDIAWQEAPDAALWDLVRDAVDACPEQAIWLEE